MKKSAVNQHSGFFLGLNSIFDLEIIEVYFEFILCRQAGVAQIPTLIRPFFQATVVEQFQLLINDEGDDIVHQAVFE